MMTEEEKQRYEQEQAEKESKKRHHVIEEDAAILPQNLAKSILVVEDNLVNQKIMVHYLQQKGYFYQIADNGLQALEKCEQYQFDLIFMDIEMPVMNGLEATQKIREKEKLTGRTTPIVGLSGNARKEMIETAISTGMNGYLTKPYSKQDVFDMIENYLNPESPVVAKETRAVNSTERSPKRTPGILHSSSPLLARAASQSERHSELFAPLALFKLEAGLLVKQAYGFLASCQGNEITIVLPTGESHPTSHVCCLILTNLKKHLKKIAQPLNIQLMELNEQSQCLHIKTSLAQAETVKIFLIEAGFEKAFADGQTRVVSNTFKSL